MKGGKEGVRELVMEGDTNVRHVTSKSWSCVDVFSHAVSPGVYPHAKSGKAVFRSEENMIAHQYQEKEEGRQKRGNQRTEERKGRKKVCATTT